MCTILSLLCALSVGVSPDGQVDANRRVGSFESLRNVDVIGGERPDPADLAALPDDFWPVGMTFDAKDLSLEFATGATVAVDPDRTAHERKAQGSRNLREPSTTSDLQWIDEEFTVRLEFVAAIVDRKGNVVFIAPEGVMTFEMRNGQVIDVYLTPLGRQHDAFWPVKFSSHVPGTETNEDIDGGVATGHQFSIKCKCDTANCGGGCGTTECENLTTCSGNCGSCAFTCAPGCK